MNTTLRSSLKAMLRHTPAYGLLRDVVRKWRLSAAARTFWNPCQDDAVRIDFYRQFVSPGAVVFDVGANLGNRSRVFWNLGASVVAVEPQPMCAGFLRKVFAGKPRLTLVEAALGREPGEGEMLLSNAHTVSSLSPHWVEAVRSSNRFGECEWSRRATVQIDTLDSLIARYGTPRFVKIDVEGFEDQVLAGLSRPVPALSIEFTPGYEEGTRRSIDHLLRLGDVSFQLSVGESMQWALPQWTDERGLMRALRDVPDRVFGDIYARFKV